MYKKTKKKIIYLDQNFISEISKSDSNPNINKKFKDIFNLLHEAFIDEKIIVPRSIIHDKETGLSTQYKKIITEHQGYIGQVKLEYFTHIFAYQSDRAVQKFLGLKAKPYNWREVFRDDPDKKIEQFDVRINSQIWEDGVNREERKKRAELLNNAKSFAIGQNRSHKYQKDCEIEAQRQLFMQKFTYTITKYFGNFEDLRKFVYSKEFINIPYINITTEIWSTIFIHHKDRIIKESDYNDVEAIATYLPYVDVYATDKFMAELIKQRKLDKKYKTKIFSSNKSGLIEFEKYLKSSLPRKKSSNWPEASIFVLPNEKIKSNSWEFFKKLGNMSCGDSRGHGWLEIFALDDGTMPKYYDSRTKQYLPFYGLQDVASIKLNDKNNDIKKLCVSKCRTKYFVLIDSYREIPDDFMNKLIANIKIGKNQILNYHIYSMP